MTPHIDDELLTRMLDLQPCDAEHDGACEHCGAAI